MLTTDHLLLADLGETLRVVLPIVFVVIYGVAHLVGALQQEQKKRAKRPQRHPLDAEPGRPERDEPAGAKPAGLEETLRREVEEFLKRAQGGAAAAAPVQRPGAKQRQRSTARPPAPPQPQGPAEPVRRRLVDDEKSVTGRKAAKPAAAATGLDLPTGAAVDAYVTDQMRSVRDIGRQADSLGDEVALADDRMEAQLQRKFDHRVGTLTRSSASTISPQDVSPGSSAAREFRELLARPGGMRQMVIASEILRRPEERW